MFAGPTATVETAASSSVGSGDVTEIEAGAIQAYAETFGIDPQQAELQLRQQELAAEFHRRLTEATGDWYAGVVFEHVPSFRVVVLRPTRAPRDLFENVAGAYESDLEIVYRDVEYTMEDLRTRLDEAARVAAAVDGRCDSRSAVLVDEIRQLVIVQVERDDIENVGEAIQQLELRSPGPDVVVEARSMWDEPASSGG